MSRRSSVSSLFSLLVMASVLCVGCSSIGPPMAWQEESAFHGAWDQALGRLHLDELSHQWGPPSALSHTGALILATWHWDHALSVAAIVTREDSAALSFGERMELYFDPDTKLLKDWQYFSWGPAGASYKHEAPRKAVLPSGVSQSVQ